MAKKTGELTPLMKQYWEIKSVHQDKIVLFRMGDFYEIFYDDAVKASPILGITLTQRNKKSEDQTPMCGFPHHSVAGPINKLLAVGLKVAICDQIEDPALAKGIVKRAVTRVLTPGMVYDSETLDQTKAHYLAAFDDKRISFVDSTTGESFYFNSESSEEKKKLISILPVAELIVESAANDLEFLNDQIVVSTFSVSDSRERLIGYIKSVTMQEVLSVLRPFEEREFEHRLQLSQNTLRHLEIFSNYKGEVQGSLFSAMDRTKTSAGARLLRQWLNFPLRQVKVIESRLDRIHDFREHMFELQKVRESLSGMGDIERRLSKIALPQCHARDLLGLAEALKAGIASLKWCELFFSNHSPSQSAHTCDVAGSLAEKILATISDEAPLSTRQGHIIRKGVSTELDELVDLSTNASSLLAQMEERERGSTGISSLKIRYNNVFGYYIEITNSHKDKVPNHYQRKQTLSNAERFYTDELIELEKKVLSAQSKRHELEYHLFSELRAKVLSMASEILFVAQRCSELDVISSLAWLSLEESYVRPVFSPENDRKLNLSGSRHPVVEQFVRKSFIANTVELASNECLLITGPNMAGKSTLMRQVALTAIMAQIGSYVAATDATLPIFDAIYTRIGASDQLSEGLSTFMVEMTETAQMIGQASDKSLLILDEVGRGTSTFDGMCLAQSILEFILKEIKTHVFFATHYHELTSLEEKFVQVKNAHMKILDHKDGQIEFLHILQNGPAGKSYGIQVAELAGIPAEIIERAKILLNKVESIKPSKEHLPKIEKIGKSVPQLSLFDLDAENKKQSLISELKKFEVSRSSPLQALNKIAEWQENLNQ